ncbi:Aldehyde/histidinol dehydrogenase [Dipodascopsis uninucleata]
MSPLIGAIAAGNTVLIKFPEQTPYTSQVLKDIVDTTLDNDAYRAVLGDLSYDFIFYTGSTKVGKEIAVAAAKNLTPYVLELGGKCPVLLMDNANMELAAKRIVWGKCMNSGQTCVAPDYILVKRGLEDEFFDALKKAIESFFPKYNKDNEDYTHLIHDNHYDRIVNMIEDTKGKIVIGDILTADRESRFVPLTVVKDVEPEDVTMQDEIFGPILPVISVNSIDEAIAYVNKFHDTPLDLYLFSSKHSDQEKVLNETTSGGLMINGTVLNVSTLYLPFGGVGTSGTGSYHGKFSFDTFSHKRAVLTHPFWVNVITGLLFPPYSESKGNTITAILAPAPSFPRHGPFSTSLAARLAYKINKGVTAGIAFLVLSISSVALFNSNNRSSIVNSISRLFTSSSRG